MEFPPVIMAELANNKFSVLVDNIHDSDDEISFRQSISEAVQCALQSESSATVPDNVQDAVDEKTKIEGAKIEDLVTRVILAVQPLLIQTVTAAVTSAVALSSKQIMQQLKTGGKEEVTRLKTETQKQRFDIDRLEQYSRKDSIRIQGIEENRDEKTNDIVVKLAKDIGVNIQDRDISVSHRLPQRAGRGRNGATRPKPLIVKFVRHDTKVAIMQKKKQLKNKEGYRNVFIDDDLTPLRNKMLRELKRDETVKRCWSIDGRIFCIQEERGQEVKRVIDSPDDLLKVGWSEEKVAEMGLFFDF